MTDEEALRMPLRRQRMFMRYADWHIKQQEKRWRT